MLALEQITLVCISYLQGLLLVYYSLYVKFMPISNPQVKHAAGLALGNLVYWILTNVAQHDILIS